MKYLFIGGSQDGKRMELPEALPMIRVPKPKSPLEATLTIETEIYRGTRLRDAKEEHIVYQLSGDDMSVIARLLAGYHPEK